MIKRSYCPTGQPLPLTPLFAYAILIISLKTLKQGSEVGAIASTKLIEVMQTGTITVPEFYFTSISRSVRL